MAYVIGYAVGALVFVLLTGEPMSEEHMAFISGGYMIPAVIFFAKALTAEIEAGRYGLEAIFDSILEGLTWPLVEMKGE